MSDVAPSENGSRDSGKSKSSSSESERDNGIVRFVRWATGGKRKRTHKKSSRRQRHRSDSRQDVAGPFSAIERRNRQSHPLEAGRERPPQTRHQNFPQDFNVGFGRQPARQSSDEAPFEDGEGHEPREYGGSDREAAENIFMPGTLVYRPADQTDQLPLMIKSGSESPPPATLTDADHPSRNPSGPSNVADLEQTVSRAYHTHHLQEHTGTGSQLNNTLPASSTQDNNALYNFRIRCLFEALAEVSAEYAEKCSFPGAKSGPSMM